jgi:hypothetical protein
MKQTSYFIILLVIAVVIQFSAYNVSPHAWAFPLNVLLGLLMVLLIVFTVPRKEQDPMETPVPHGFFPRLRYEVALLVHALSSRSCTLISIAFFMVCCLVLGLVPQHSEAEAAMENLGTGYLGVRQFTTSWIFLFSLLLLMTNLGYVTIGAIRTKRKNRWRFFLNHAGLWIVLFSLFFGSADMTTVRTGLYNGEKVTEGVTADGHTAPLGFLAVLHKFQIDYYENGTPMSFRADMNINDEPVTIRVNHPYMLNLADDVYLTSYELGHDGQPDYCILQVVHQPWRYVTLLGIIMMAAAAVLMFVRKK